MEKNSDSSVGTNVGRKNLRQITIDNEFKLTY